MEKANTNDRMWGKLETRSQLESGEDTPPREGLEKGYSPVTAARLSFQKASTARHQ